MYLTLHNDQHSLSLVDLPFSPALVTKLSVTLSGNCPSFAVTVFNFMNSLSSVVKANVTYLMPTPSALKCITHVPGSYAWCTVIPMSCKIKTIPRYNKYLTIVFEVYLKQ